MPVLSLRLTLAVLSAVTVALVASVTLSLALTSSLSALRSMGERHAGALLVTANDLTEGFFKQRTDVAEKMINVTGSRNWTDPSDDPRTLDMYFGLLHASWMGGSQTSAVNTWFRDNTHVFIDGAANPDLAAQGLYEARITYATSYAQYYPNQTVWAERLAYSRATHRYVRNVSAPGGEFAVRYRHIPSLWSGTFEMGTNGGTTPVIFPMISSHAFSGMLMTYVPFIAPLYTPNAPARTHEHVFAYFLQTAVLDDISTFLRRAKSTPGTAAFAYDQTLHLLGSSEPTSFLEVYDEPHPVGPGCTATRDTGSPATWIFDQKVVCRYATSAYPHAPLNALTAQDAAFLLPAPGEAPVQRIGDLGGEPYYVASLKVPVAFVGMAPHLVLLMPEADVIGDVITSRNVAIGVTCGLVVLAAAANVAVVWLLLAPLGGIAERMVRAANLEDDDDDASVSVMAEVAELQEAYYAMNAELNRIRSYVPQSVLVARKVARGAGSASELDTDTTMQLSGSVLNSTWRAGSLPVTPSGSPPTVVVPVSPSSASSRRVSKASLSHAASHGSESLRRRLRADADASRAAAEVSLRNVSVALFNVRGLHCEVADLSTHMGIDTLVVSIAAATALVETAVTQRHGVLTFHGDRFLATFNTARPCAGHASKAALVAVAVAGQPVGPAGLTLSTGVATGPCAVGSMGSATMKTLSTVGPAVSNAAALERLTRQHQGVNALATHRTCADAATAVGVRYVDLALLQGNKGGARRATAVGELRALEHASEAGGAAGGGDAEWMYVLQGAGGGAHAAYNDVFEALQQDGAAAALQAYAAVEAAVAKAAAESKTADGVQPTCPPRLSEIIAQLRKAPEGTTVEVADLCTTAA